MTYTKIAVNKIAPHLGAEIGGVDLSRPLADDVMLEIRAALAENLVIFFRDQSMTPAEQKDFGRQFGELFTHPAAPQLVPGHPEILTVHADANSKRIDGENWHSDISCDIAPPMGSILYLTEVPPIGGDTLFASMYAAYDSFSPEMQRFLCGLTAMHDGERQHGGRFGSKTNAASEHPVVVTHPVTGRKALFVNPIFTTHIVQLKAEESNALLQFLYLQTQRPQIQCRFQWRAKSVAFWDNRCVQHMALWDYFPHRRHGHRITIRGERPVYLAA